MPNKKIVLDTNGLISSLSRRGQFYPIWRSFQQGRYTLCISNEILDEYIEIISQKMTPEIATYIVSDDSHFNVLRDITFPNCWCSG